VRTRRPGAFIEPMGSLSERLINTVRMRAASETCGQGRVRPDVYPYRPAV